MSHINHTRSRLRRLRSGNAYRVYLFIEAAYSLLFAVYGTMTTVYRVEVAHLNPLQLTLVGTALEGGVFLFQLPTGVFADTMSRRLSVIIGVFLVGAGLLLEGSFTTFGTILCAQVLWGAGYTFVSGAEEAWLADEIGVEAAGQAYLRASQLGGAVSIAGIVISVALGSVLIRLPLLVAGGLFLALGGVLIAIMPESGFRGAASSASATAAGMAAVDAAGERAALAASSDGAGSGAIPAEAGDAHSTWRALRETFGRSMRLVVKRPILLTILGITFIWGMSSEGFDRLGETRFLLNLHLPSLGPLNAAVGWFGIFSMGATLLTIGVVEVIRRRVDTNSHRSVTRTLFVATALLTASVIVFGLTGNFALALGFYWLITVIRGVSNPLYTAWVNQSTDARVRATVLSMTGQADAFGQIAGGPIVGAIGLYAGLQAALVTAGAALSPALLLFARALGQGEQTAPLVAVNADDTATAEADGGDTGSKGSCEAASAGEPAPDAPALVEQAAPPAKEAQPASEN